MAFSLERKLKEHTKLMLVRSGLPSINRDYIFKAIDQLNKSDVVFASTEDGGFCLVWANFILKRFSRVSLEVVNHIQQGLCLINLPCLSR